MQMMERVATGINFIDDNMVGLPKYQPTLVSGGSGIGKTVLGLQFIKTGLYTDESVAYVVTRDCPESIFDTLQELGWDLDWAFEQDRFKILDLRDIRLQIKQLDAQTNRDSLPVLDEVFRIIAADNIQRLVVDMVTDEDREIWISYMNKHGLKVTSVLLYHDVSEPMRTNINSLSNQIQLFFTRDSLNYKRTAVFVKMNQTQLPPQSFFYEIKYQTGLCGVT